MSKLFNINMAKFFIEELEKQVSELNEQVKQLDYFSMKLLRNHYDEIQEKEKDELLKATINLNHQIYPLKNNIKAIKEYIENVDNELDIYSK